MNNQQLIHLSQSQLTLLETCPPQFQRLYLEQLGFPINPEQQERITWGSQFHQLMQQRDLDLPIDVLLEADEELKQSIMALLKATSEIWQSEGEIWREAEHCRTLKIRDYLMTVIYDLLIVDEEQVQILDWKTYLEPENKSKVEKSWQTRLYLYILAETSAYEPEQISMTYWFVKLPKKPKKLTVKYNRKNHEKTEQDLNNLLTKLETYLRDYLDNNLPFPHVTNCWEKCDYAKVLGIENEDTRLNTDWLTGIEGIEEVPISL